MERSRFLIRILRDQASWLLCRPEQAPLRYLDETRAINAGDSMARIHTLLTGQPSGVVLAGGDERGQEQLIRLHG